MKTIMTAMALAALFVLGVGVGSYLHRNTLRPGVRFDEQKVVTKERIVYLLDDLRECKDATPVVCSCVRADVIPSAPTPKRRGPEPKAPDLKLDEPATLEAMR